MGCGRRCGLNKAVLVHCSTGLGGVLLSTRARLTPIRGMAGAITTLTTTNATYHTLAMNLERISRDSDWAGSSRERMTV
jgi:hypothetical protein